MIYEPSPAAVMVFAVFVAAVLILSFFLGAKAKSSQGYFAAHGQVHWFVNGVAFAGDYLSAASFLGICGMIAFYGYDGFLYSIGYLAGWVVALFVIAEPLKRLGRFTFADALDNRFHSRGIKLSAALSTLAVSLFYLIPQMVGAGTLVRPLLGFSYQAGVDHGGGGRHPDRRDGRDGLDDLRAVHQGGPARRLLHAPDRHDPPSRALDRGGSRGRLVPGPRDDDRGPTPRRPPASASCRNAGAGRGSPTCASRTSARGSSPSGERWAGRARSWPGRKP